MVNDNHLTNSGQSPDVRSFHIGDILSIVPGNLVALRHMRGVYEILNFMTRDSLSTHQLPRASRECESYLLRQHPWLEQAGAELQVNIKATPYNNDQTHEENCLRWIAPLIAKYGEYHDVRRIPMDDHDVIDAVGEAIARLGADRVIPIEFPDEDEPSPYGDLPEGVGGGLGPIFVNVDDAPPAFYEPIDVQTELVYLRSRRIITANDCLMAEQLFKCQIAAASNGAQRAEISAQWMAQLAALKAVS